MKAAGSLAALPVTLIALALAPCGALAKDSPSVGGATLAPGWNCIATGTGTGCVDGGEYAFYVRPGSPSKLAIMFMGGGVCWSGASCDTCGDAGPSEAYRLITSEKLTAGKGLLDFADSRNPIRDYTVVFIPNCTLDVLLGSRVIPYPAAPNACRSDSVLSIRHLGSMNSGAALEWVFNHMGEPKTVFVTGQSGGAIPSPFYAVRIARRYPHARVVQLGNAAGGYLQGVYGRPLELWGALDVLRGGWGTAVPADSLPWTWEKIYVVASRLAPKATWAQVNSANDGVQTRILKSIGVEQPVSEIMTSNLAMLHREIGPRFRSYTLEGTAHMTTLLPDFYGTEEGGVKLRDWIANLLEGKHVENVGDRLLAKSQ